MRIIGWVSILLFILGCGKEKPPIPEEEMINVLRDVHIAEGLTNSHHAIDMRDSLQELYLEQVLKTHNIDRKIFENAMAHLHSDPQYLEIIYSKVLLELNQMSREIDDEEERRRNEENQFRNRN